LGLVVNADDFGISQEVNEAICQSFKRGLIDRTTLMVNMPFAKEALEIAAQNDFLDKVGIHLNLTAGRPVTAEISKDSLICDDNGEFTADFARNMKTRFVFPKTTAQNVRREIKAQLDEFEKLGGVLFHIDSHHHVHTDPSVYKELVKVLEDYSVTGVRLGRNMYKGGNPLMHVYKRILNSSIRRFCLAGADYFGSMEDYLNWTDDMDDATKKAFITGNQIEIMVHPMFDDKGALTDSLCDFTSVHGN